MSTEISDTEKNELAELLDFHGVVHKGDVLVIESERCLTAEQSKQLAAMFDGVLEKFGVGIILLDGGLRVAGKRASI